MNKNINNKSVMRGIRFEHQMIKDVEYLRDDESFGAFVKDAVSTKLAIKGTTQTVESGKFRCHVCHYYWPSICFQKDRTKPSGLSPRCKNCESIKKAAYKTSKA